MRGPISEVMQAAGAQVGVLFALSITSNILMLTGSIFMLQVYDRVLPSRSMPTLVALTGLVVILYGFYALIEWIRARMAARIGGLFSDRLSVPLFRVGVRQRLHGGRRRAEPLRDLDTLRQFASGTGPISLLDLPWMPIYLGLAFILHPLLGLTATAGAVVICGLLLLNEVFSRRPVMEGTAAAAERNALANDAERNAEAISAMGMMQAMSRRFAAASGTMMHAQLKATDRAALYSSVTKGFRYLLQSAVLAIGALLVIRGQTTGGLMIAASILTSRALAPVEQVVANWRGFVGARQAAQRIRDHLKSGSIGAPETELPLPTQTLSVEAMATGPEPNGPLIAGGVEFSLEAGDGMGIVGLSGSGKSSVARALVGVWPVLRGEIRLDGSEMSHYSVERLGTRIGYLPQDVELSDGTVAENISRFSDDPDPAAILGAATAARVHDLITSLPGGYDTSIGEGGFMLSAGQRQRIGLARALFGDPFLLVLDEPNSNLDSEGDLALTEALLDARRRGAIVVVVAHRPSAITAVNKLLFMRDGRQVLFGPKNAVLQRITGPVEIDRVGNDASDDEAPQPARLA